MLVIADGSVIRVIWQELNIFKRHDSYMVSCVAVGGGYEKNSGTIIAGRIGVGRIQFPLHSFGYPT